MKLSMDPPYAQLVYLHGDVDRYEDRNLEEETRELDGRIRDAVLALLRDHPLVVIGYRGGEQSVMRDLLLRAAAEKNAFRHGIYWCTLPDEPLAPMVVELASTVGTNFRLVEITGFDDAMVSWGAEIKPALAPRIVATEPDVPDLRPTDTSLNGLDRGAVAERLAAYASAMGMTALGGDDWAALRERLEELRLLRRDDSGLVVTRAALLLFGEDDVTRVEIRSDDVFLPVAGNLFAVLDRVLEAIAELNTPIRLKGPTSQTVRRFDPRAIKELLVNAVVHRNHDLPDPVRIKLSARELTVVSPGGLTDGMTPERLGEPGARAYRNPVLADLLYGCGAMDKRGSGLADVRRWARQSGGDATFGLSDDGQRFVAALRTRDIDADPVTGTADPGQVEQFLSNALSVELRSPIQTAIVRESYRREIYDRHPGALLPGFAMEPGRVFTFANLSGVGSLLAPHAVGRVESNPPSDYYVSPDRERVLVQLLNSTLLAWARSQDMYSDASSQRIWFPRSDDGAREVTYQARIREATRTVTRPKVSQASGKVRYWEHEGIRFRFRRYADEWVLHLVPCFVFTTNGLGTLLKGSRVGPLATRRIARDFNPQVQHDLYFWRWVLTEGAQEVCLGDDAIWVRSEFISCDVFDAPAASGAFDSSADEIDDDVLEEIAAIAAEQDDQQ